MKVLAGSRDPTQGHVQQETGDSQWAGQTSVESQTVSL